MLEAAEVFDVYAGKGIPEGKKSVAIALRFRAADRTLTADEASEARAAATELAAQRPGAVTLDIDRPLAVIVAAAVGFAPVLGAPAMAAVTEFGWPGSGKYRCTKVTVSAYSARRSSTKG